MLRRSFLPYFLSAWLLVLVQGFAFSATRQDVGAMQTTGEYSQAHATQPPGDDTFKQVDTILPRPKNDQVKQLSIAEPQKGASDHVTGQGDKEDSRPLPWSLRGVESGFEFAYRRVAAVATNFPNLPKDIAQALGRLTDGKGVAHLALMMAIIAAILMAGFGIEKLFKRSTADFVKKIESVPPMEGLLKFLSAVLKILPELLNIIIFTISSLVLFLPIHGMFGGSIHLLFIACLAVIIISRLISALSLMLCSPDLARLRLVSLSDQASDNLHRNLVRILRLMVFAIVISRLFYLLKIPVDSFILIVIPLGTAPILLIAGVVWKNRSAVANSIMKSTAVESQGRSWFKEQLAAIWHIPALCYLLVIWLLGAGRMVLVGPVWDHATLVSLLIAPIYVALDRAGQWLVMATAGVMRASREEAELQEEQEAAEETLEGRYNLIARQIVRIIIIVTLLFWLIEIWGFSVPFQGALIKAAFSILITLMLAHIAWGLISSVIRRKLLESLPAKTEDTSEGEDEWGGQALGRSHTLLPMLQKFVGSVLVVMVTLIILSSIGIDIGPLIAGAGVAGIAIGFGAQKLVADVFSGIFFLIDDSFRVGEYLKAGQVSGSVEKITLRNLWLRHHRGMLQIIPLSDLGSITNYMRGGLVVKFNLELPYDTDIEKVRKIIKKVGQAMLSEEKYAQDFIKPVKSQGVKTVGNSVMTFRAKFTAIPGKHFVIRREAFRRIKEALEKAGIHLAHRTVIVDLPQPQAPNDQVGGAQSGDTAETSKHPNMDANQTLKAGAASALDTILEEEKKGAQAQK